MLSPIRAKKWNRNDNPNQENAMLFASFVDFALVSVLMFMACAVTIAVLLARVAFRNDTIRNAVSDSVANWLKRWPNHHTTAEHDEKKQ